MNTATKFFLVLLRLAIGWLFLFEGLEKIQSFDYGPTGAVRPWTSAGYLREAAGPASPFFHWQAGGNPDQMALNRLSLAPVEEAGAPPRKRVSAALTRDWADTMRRAIAYYGFDEAQSQKAQAVVEQHLDRAADWLAGKGGEKPVENTTWPEASFKVNRTFAQRVEAYKKKLDEIRQLQDDAFASFGKDVAGPKLRALKSEAAKMRNELMSDLETPYLDDLKKLLTDEQKAKGPLPGPEPVWTLRWSDKAIAYGLVVIGGGLLLGLFTRLSCVGGATFLVMLYLAMPAWPWLPEVVRAEGHYLFVTKNLILAVGLLALATTESGRWFGLDALLHALNPFRRRPAASH